MLITKEKIKILKEADYLFIKALRDHGLYHKIWQAYAALLPVKTVGVMGDNRTYEFLCLLRAITSEDGMTADYYDFINPKIRRQVQIHCTSFWLDLDVPLLKERLINSKKRPLLKNNDLNSVLEKIYKDRKKIYALADFKIDCKKLNVESVANKIIELNESK